MIKIRYSPLPEGLHAQACREGGHTIVYFRPGLSAEQRQEALRRARQSARMGHGPRLPAAGLAAALAADRVGATIRNIVAAVRCHPVGTGMLAALVAGAVVSYALFVTVSVRIIYPQVQAAPAAPRPAVTASQSAGPGGTPARHHSLARSPGGAGSSPAAVATPSRDAAPVTAGSAAAQPSPQTQPPSPAPSPSSSPASASPSATVGGGGAVGVCVKVGPLGVCLKV